MAALNIVQLREVLGERFSSCRRANELPLKRHDVWSTGLVQLDQTLGGGFPTKAISEVVAPQNGSGSALMILQLLRTAATQRKFVALISGTDSFDAAAVEQRTLDSLLWVRCRTAGEAVQATDLVLRDGNVQIVLLDLALNPKPQLNKIPAPVWYRFQRIIEDSGVTLVVITPMALVTPAEVRISVQAHVDLTCMESAHTKLLMRLEFSVTQADETLVSETLRKMA
jgi:hypothetical protein